jgi:hypothetical protein
MFFTHIHNTIKNNPIWFWAVILVSLFLPFAASAATGPIDMLEGALGNIMLNIASFFTWAGGVLLQYSVENFILKIGELIGNKAPLGLMIGTLWGLVRDMCNLAFIFGFIYIGIRTIIDADDSNAKRMLASLIIGAVLINFSLYFTKVVIDVSNYTAVEIYDAVFTGDSKASLSTKFAQSVGLHAFYNPLEGKLLAQTAEKGGISFFFMASLFLMVAGFVFAAGGLLLIVRFVALVFIMIFSPILFAASVFPATSGYASKLWHQLINYAFFAPAYLVMLLISIKVVGALTEQLNPTKTALNVAMTKGTVSTYGVIVVFIIGIMALIYSLKVAQQLGVAGADRTLAVGKNLRGRLQGAVGRNTVGRVSNWALKKYEKDDARIGQAKGVRGAVLRTIRGGLVMTGADEGLRNTLKSGKTAKFGGSKSFEDNKKWNTERDAKRAQINEYDNFKKALKEGQADNASDDKKIAMERAIADASIKYLEDLDQDDRKKIVKYMKQSQFDGLDKSTELTDTDKRELHEARKANLEEIYKVEKEQLTKASVDNLNALGAKYLEKEEHAVRLNSSQMDDLKKNLTPTEFKNLSEARENALIKLAKGESVVSGKDTLTQEYLTKQKPNDIAKLPSKVLVQMGAKIPITALSKISQEGTLNKQDQAAIRDKISEELARVTAPGGQTDPGDIQRVQETLDWLADSPLGKQFGK